jgi:hypothetical protein
MGMGLGAAVSGLVSTFQYLSTQTRESANFLKGSFTASAQAASLFGVSFAPLGNYDFAAIKDGIDKHKQSIADNKAAVDQLTQAYLSASDQMTKDYISKVKGLSAKDLLKSMNEKYSSDTAAGFTPQQAMRDVVSVMNAAERQAGEIAYVKQNLTTPSNINEAISNLTKYAVKNAKPDAAATEKKQIAQEAVRSLNQRMIQEKLGQQGLTGSALAASQGRVANYQKQITEQNKILKTPDQGGLLNKDTLTSLTPLLQQLSQGPLKNLQAAFTQLNNKVISNKQTFTELSTQMSKQWPGFDKFATKLGASGGKTIDLTKAMFLLTHNLVKVDDLVKALNSGDTKGLAALWDKFAKDPKTADALNGLNGGGGGGLSAGPADYSKQYSPLIKHLTDVRKLINAQAEAQKKYNDQLKATQDYNIKQMDYFNQMKNAMTSGNFLGAAQIKESAKASQADFAATIQQQKQQDAIANLDNMLATVQDASTGGKTFAAWAKANPGLAKFATSKYDSSLLGGITPANYSKNTSGIIARATSAQESAAAAAGGGPFQSLVVNVSADNSVIPEQFSKSLAAQIQAAVQKAYAKSQTSHKVGGNTTTKGVKVK